MATKVKRVDSNRTDKAKRVAIQRRIVRSTYAQNGGRF
jgi:hypothetical protein